MEVIFWTIAVCATLLVAGVRGWCRRFTGQICAVTGFCIASLCAHVFCNEVPLAWLSPFVSSDSVAAPYVTGFLSAAAVYVVVYEICTLFTSVLRRALSRLDAGVVDALFGAVFGMFNGALWLSLLMNVWLCINPEGELLRLCGSDDANAPQVVLLLAPAVLGSPGADDLYHAVQLREARKISHNIHAPHGVITYERSRNLSAYPAHDFSSLRYFKNEITQDNA